MRKIDKKLSRFLNVLIIPIVLITCMILSGYQKTAIPENPLTSEANPSKVLPDNGNTIGIDDNYLANLMDADINKAKGADEESDDASEESNNEKEEQQQNSSENIEDSKREENKSPNKEENNSGSSDISDNVGDSDKLNPNNPGDTQRPSEDTTEIVYFTTTIKDGELIYSREYSFTITHKQKELRIENETVYINNVIYPQFKGDVLLEDGKNTIRIAVTYVREDGKKISVYQDYVVYVDLGSITIETDLKNQTVETSTINFTATATLKDKTIPIDVKCNGVDMESSSGNYTVDLIEGSNTIELSAKSGDKSITQTYSIQCNLPKEFSIKTDLEDDQIVNTDSLSFTASMVNGSSKSRLTVVCNGKTMLPVSEDEYTVPLKIGTNVIRLKATDIIDGEKVTLDQSYKIKYVPIANEETKPVIKHINVTDNMEVTGNKFTLDVLPEDYKGNRIYSEGITVRLNGVVYQNNWQSEYTSYLLFFEGGINALDVRITDSEGRYTDYSYKINCTTIEDGEKIGEITLSIDANVLGLGYIVAPVQVDVLQGETASYSISRFLEENGFTYDNTGSLDVGFYLARLARPGIGVGVAIPEDLKQAIDEDGLEWKDQRYDDSIGEFDYCQGSGWMYSVNGAFPNYGLSDAVFKDGDVVRIRFTLAYGRDIGGATATGGSGGNYSKVW
ncbi:DUF4430 domain-containing protein [Clostridium culturomicium]|uniref:DUF4430 domain-containing protein n=1 Tax=Clostridium culturomicium TaxID=1499683 RepID=UPI00058EF558|nr:DUF4430 domain-containing protein [Clostridium culturomicium]